MQLGVPQEEVPAPVGLLGPLRPGTRSLDDSPPLAGVGAAIDAAGSDRLLCHGSVGLDHLEREGPIAAEIVQVQSIADREEIGALRDPEADVAGARLRCSAEG